MIAARAGICHAIKDDRGTSRDDRGTNLFRQGDRGVLAKLIKGQQL